MTRHRHRAKTIPAAPPKGYPNSAERLRIIQHRRELSMILMRYHFEGVQVSDPRYQQLIRQHGAHEISFLLESYNQSTLEHDNLLDEPYSYRKYRQAFAIFGGQRRYLSCVEHSDLQMEFMKLFVPRAILNAPPVQRPIARESELYDLLLAEVDYWRDITPLAIPPRPADYPAPRLEYPAELQPLFEVGPEPSSAQKALFSCPPAGWEKYITELMRLLFAPDLLQGWPGDHSAWAPLYALRALGALRAAETAPFMLKLMDDPNDWLSDLLPAVWNSMGPGVIPLLWASFDQPLYTEKKRAQAVFGLEKLAQTSDRERAPIIAGLLQRLKTVRGNTPTLNAYLIHILHRLQVSQAQKTVRDLFKKGWMNEKIVSANDF